MTEALRARIKERLIASNLCSDGAGAPNPSSDPQTAAAVALNLAALKLEGSTKVTGTPPAGASRKNVRSQS